MASRERHSIERETRHRERDTASWGGRDVTINCVTKVTSRAIGNEWGSLDNVTKILNRQSHPEPIGSSNPHCDSTILIYLICYQVFRISYYPFPRPITSALLSLILTCLMFYVLLLSLILTCFMFHILDLTRSRFLLYLTSYLLKVFYLLVLSHFILTDAYVSNLAILFKISLCLN